MGRKGTFVTETRAENYDFKQTMIRTDHGRLPDYLATKALASANKQVQNWNKGFGTMHSAWLAARDRVLSPGNVQKMDYAKYKAFINEYVSKVATKGSETSDMVKSKFTRLGADAGVLDSITAVIGEVLAA